MSDNKLIENKYLTSHNIIIGLLIIIILLLIFKRDNFKPSILTKPKQQQPLTPEQKLKLKFANNNKLTVPY